MDFFKDRLKEASTWGGLASLGFALFTSGGHMDGGTIMQMLTSFGMIFTKEHKQ
jgi:hypothetical protein